MRFYEFAKPSLSNNPTTSDEQRLKSLKSNKERADKTLKQERERQKLLKAQNALNKLRISPI